MKEKNNYVNNKQEPIVIMVMGRTAAGKTTTSYKLAKILGYQNISCAYYKRLIKPNYSKEDSLNEDFRNAGLKLAIEEAIKMLNNGHSVILDSSFGVKKRRQFVIEELKPFVSNFFIVYCVTSDVSETRRRIESRKGREQLSIKYHASDFKVFEHVNSTFEEPTIEELNKIFDCFGIFQIDTFLEKVISEPEMKSNVTEIISNALVERFSSMQVK